MKVGKTVLNMEKSWSIFKDSEYTWVFQVKEYAANNNNLLESLLAEPAVQSRRKKNAEKTTLYSMTF